MLGRSIPGPATSLLCRFSLHTWISFLIHWRTLTNIFAPVCSLTWYSQGSPLPPCCAGHLNCPYFQNAGWGLLGRSPPFHSAEFRAWLWRKVLYLAEWSGMIQPRALEPILVSLPLKELAANFLSHLVEPLHTQSSCSVQESCYNAHGKQAHLLPCLPCIELHNGQVGRWRNPKLICRTVSACAEHCSCRNTPWTHPSSPIDCQRLNTGANAHLHQKHYTHC